MLVFIYASGSLLPIVPHLTKWKYLHHNILTLHDTQIVIRLATTNVTIEMNISIERGIGLYKYGSYTVYTTCLGHPPPWDSTHCDLKACPIP